MRCSPAAGSACHSLSVQRRVFRACVSCSALACWAPRNRLWCKRSRSEAEVARAKRNFERIDKDGDGYICLEDFIAAMVRLDPKWTSEAQQEAATPPAARAAIAADPGHACAHNNLGVLLENHRKDIDGAEEQYRLAIKLDPNYASAHINLGNLLKGDGILKGSEGVLQGVDRGRPE